MASTSTVSGPASEPPRRSAGAAEGRRAGASTFLVIVASAAAGLAMTPVFGARPLWRPVLIGAIVPATVIALLRPPRVRLLVSSTVAAAAAAVASGPAVFRSTTAAAIFPTGATLHALGDGFQNGWARILTAALPADPSPALLFVPFGLAALSGWIGTELAHRTRSSVAPTVPPVLALVTTQAFVIATGTWSRTAVVVTVLAAAAIVLVRSLPQPSSAAGLPVFAARRLLRGVPAAVALALVAVLAAPHLPGAARANPVDPREHRRLDPPPQSAINPLTQLSLRIEQPDPVLFTFRADGDPPPRLRQVVLDRYDGTEWSTAADYVAAGQRLPPGPHLSVARRDVTLTIRVGKLDGIWLPIPDGAAALSGIPAAWDGIHQVAAVAKGEVTARRYTVQASVPEPTAAQIQTAPVTRDAADLRLPQPVPSALGQLAQVAVRGANSPAERAKALQLYLQARFRLPKPGTGAPSGHAYGNLTYLVDQARGDFLGTPEQFAATYAVMARSIGLPTRVVVGFHTPQPDAGGMYRVRAGDATAWPEVDLQGVGWTAFDPDPGPAKTASQRQTDPPGAHDASDAVHTNQGDTSTAKRTPATPHRRSLRSHGSSWWWALVALGALVVAALGLLGGRLAVRRRRAIRRRRHRDPLVQLRGAWQEVTEALRRDGIEVPPSTGAAALQATASANLPPESGRPVADFADLVNRTMFRRGGPSPADAAEAWTHVDAYHAARRHSRGGTTRHRHNPAEL
ncbi:MAG TPA: transglutaminaseTgpA domain-containing protein [Acidimicrobiales bacterium]|jgi:transglutaminase-like putative cysteine protease|nr:transglutaminaseTgpA domain-containing protein [Acidimicrobiales bacterium]